MAAHQSSQTSGVSKNSTHILRIGTTFGQPSRPWPENVSSTMVILLSSGLQDVIIGDIT